MKKLVLSLVAVTCTHLASAQCTTNSFITTNYTEDAKILALREILSDPADPDYDNPVIPTSRYQPYLDGLSVIYSNTNNLQVADSMFVEFQIHVNPEYNYEISTPYKLLKIKVPNSTSWLNNFLTTGISGESNLDGLMSTYNFSINSSIQLNSCNCTWIELESSTILNVNALTDDFTAISGISFSEGYLNTNFFNYTGIPYEIQESEFGYTDSVMVTDIKVTGNIYTFNLYAGDCYSGCMITKKYDFMVNTNTCTFIPMATEEINRSAITIYPNPANDYIMLTNAENVAKVSIYNTNGMLVVETNQTHAIAIENLEKGLYFVSLTGVTGNTTTQKMIKQ